MEHTGLGFETLKTQFALCRGLPIVPMVRVPRSEYHFIARALDVGALGVMVPMVEHGRRGGAYRRPARAIRRRVDAARRSASRTTTTRAATSPKRSRRSTRARWSSRRSRPSRASQRRGDRRSARRRRAVARPFRPDQFHGHPGRSSTHPDYLAAVARIVAACEPAGQDRRRSSPPTSAGHAMRSRRGFRMLAYGIDQLCCRKRCARPRCCAQIRRRKERHDGEVSRGI